MLGQVGPEGGGIVLDSPGGDANLNAHNTTTNTARTGAGPAPAGT